VDSACSTHLREEKQVVLLGKPEGKRLIGRCIYKLGDNVRKDIEEIAWKDGDWIQLAYDRE
jgi:hypothetical protein